MSFTHIVTFKWNDGSVDSQAIADALKAVVATVDGVQSYTVGPDIGLSPGTFDFGLVGVFDSREDWAAYRDNAEHQRIIKEMILPHVDTRTSVQLEE
jgi:hypothetical protein